MDFDAFFAQLEEAFLSNALAAPGETEARLFAAFTERLAETNAHTNLTAIRDLAEVPYKHYADSILAAEHLPSGATVLDVGCGAGFPSVPLAIWRPDLHVTALDSTEKKVRFVRESAEALGLSNLTAIAGRAEDFEIRRTIGQVDAVVSRAVARLCVLSELCLPYLKVGGVFVALKGAKGGEELAEAQNGIKILGGEAVLHKITLHTPAGDEERTLIVVKKCKPTPPQYPRAYAAIVKKPL